MECHGEHRGPCTIVKYDDGYRRLMAVLLGISWHAGKFASTALGPYVLNFNVSRWKGCGDILLDKIKCVVLTTYSC